MVNYTGDSMDTVFKALADRTRRGMIERLSHGPASIGELGRPFSISKPAVTKHIQVLERAMLVTRTKDGRVHRCQLNTTPLEQAADWIDTHRKFWETSLDSLARYLDETTKKGNHS